MTYEDLLISLSDISAEQAYEILEENPNHEHKSGYEFIIKKDSYHAYSYALNIIKGRFLEAEEYIKKDPDYACRYAKFIIKDKNFWEKS